MSAAIALFLLAFGAVSVKAASVSISSYSPYNGQTACVKRCLWHAGALDDLIAAIGCSTPWTNECFCQADLASSASEFVSGCVASQCTTPRTGLAVTRALSVYNNYCSANGFSIPTVASIKSYSAYALQPDCVQQCLWHVGALDDLMPAIGCNAPWDNSCLCNATQASSVGAFLSTCVASRCSTATDAPRVTDAISVHSAYCSEAGLPIPVAAVATTTVPATSTQSPSSSGLSSTRTTADSHEEGSATGLSPGAIAGIAIGGVAGLAAVIAAAAFIMCKRRRRPAVPKAWVVAGAHHPPQIHEKSTDPAAVEADSDWGGPAIRHELPAAAYR